MTHTIRDALDWIFKQPLLQIPVLLQILEVVRREQRRTQAGRGVLPWEVQPWLVRYVPEQTIRRLMALMWRVGLLDRIGGAGARRGYRLAVA